MSVRDVFKKGDRVRPSRKSMAGGLWLRRAAPTGGVVAATPHSRLYVTVRWDGHKTASQFHAEFISRERKGTRT